MKKDEVFRLRLSTADKKTLSALAHSKKIPPSKLIRDLISQSATAAGIVIDSTTQVISHQEGANG